MSRPPIASLAALVTAATLATPLLPACSSSSRPATPAAPATPATLSPAATWTKVDGTTARGKQDDIFFVDEHVGYYASGPTSSVRRSTDGGATWTTVLEKPGTYFRALGFVDADHGFVGNLGVDAFPGVTDTTPLYETKDGGKTWTAVTAIEGPPPVGICAIDVLHDEYINAGKRETRVILHAAGRVSGPAMIMTSMDGGASWRSRDLSAEAGMILDVKFVDARTGFLCAASSADPQEARALILKTTDAGASWRKVYESKGPWQLTWKCAFPSKRVGYATVQDYDQDPTHTRRVVAKTEDGGETWREVLLVEDAQVNEFGIGFLDERVGWVGAVDGGYHTTDGGETWTHVAMGTAVNKIRVLRGADGGVHAWAIGVDVWRLVTGD